MLCATRGDRFKFHFAVQMAKGLDVWNQPFTVRRGPLIVDLLADPFERAWEEGLDYNHWFAEHLFLFVPAQVKVKQFLETFKSFPPRQKGASFGIDQMLATLVPPAKIGA